MAQSSSTPSRPSSGRALFGFLGVLLFVCGALLGRLSAHDSRPNDAAARSADTARILHAIDELEKESKRQRASTSTAPRDAIADPSPTSERQPVARDSELEALVQRLERALLARDQAGAPATTSWRSPRPGRSSLDEIKLAFDTRSTDQGHESLTEELTAAHMLWTVDDVIARYGMPRRAGNPGSTQLSLVYAFGTDDRPFPRPSARFLVIEGRVIHVEVDD